MRGVDKNDGSHPNVGRLVRDGLLGYVTLVGFFFVFHGVNAGLEKLLSIWMLPFVEAASIYVMSLVALIVLSGGLLLLRRCDFISASKMVGSKINFIALIFFVLVMTAIKL